MKPWQPESIEGWANQPLHAAHLAILAFVEGKFNPAVRNVLVLGQEDFLQATMDE